MVVCREEAETTTALDQMVHSRTGNSGTIEGRSSAAKLVHDHQAATTRPTQRSCRFSKLDEEGRLTEKNAVRRTEACEDPIDRSELARVGGYKAAHLREDGDQTSLAKERTFLE